MIPSYAKLFSYQIPWKSSSLHFGGHRGTQRGLGFEYRGNVPLIDYPDARRMDLRQTLQDPYEQIQVKIFKKAFLSVFPPTRCIFRSNQRVFMAVKWFRPKFESWAM